MRKSELLGVGCLVLGLAILISGCGSVKVYRCQKDRVDTDVSGNQGVIYGPTPAPHKVEGSRDVMNMDVELPTVGGGKEAAAVEPRLSAPAQDTESRVVSEASAETNPAKKEKIK